MPTRIVAQSRLKSLLHYDPLTGISNWLVSLGRAKAGNVAGVFSHGYIRIRIDGRTYAAHRLAWLYMTGEWPEYEIDHKNGVRNDNRWSNLREVDRTGNSRNSSLSANNTSGVSGVSMNSGKWRVCVMINGKYKHFGRYADYDEAVKVRNKAYKDLGFTDRHGLPGK